MPVAVLLFMSALPTLLLPACGPPGRRAAAGGGGGGGGDAGGGDGGGDGGGHGGGDGGGPGGTGAGDDGGDQPGGAEEDGPGEEGEGEGEGEEGEGEEGEGDDEPFAFYDCGDTVFPDEPIDDLRDAFTPASWRRAVVGVLDRRLPDGAFVAGELGEDFDRWFGDRGSWDAVLNDVNTGVHEGVHILGFKNGGFGDYTFILGEGDQVMVTRVELFYRSEVYDVLPPEVRDGFYADTYLREIGDQGIESLLDEFNAYTWSLLVDVAIADQFDRFSRRSSRDGLVTFMLFTEAYLRIARTEHPDDYDRLIETRPLAELVLTLFDRAWCVLGLSGDDPRLEIDAAQILPYVLADEWLSEVDRLREAIR